MLFTGIDISKKSFDISVLRDRKYKPEKFDNSKKGFKKLDKFIEGFGEEIIICMEATGIYGIALAKHLYASGHKVIVENPLKIHAFAKMEMTRSKTDKADAQLIARYAKHLYDNGKVEKSLFAPKAQAWEQLQALYSRLEQLEKMRIQENNRLEACLDNTSSKSIRSLIRSIERQIDNVSKAAQKLVEEDEEIDRQIKLLTSIPAIGFKTAFSIIACVGDVKLFQNSKQLCAYAGLNPQIEQSGTSVNRSSLSKLGNKKLRKALYMPAVVAITHNPLMKDLYERITTQGKANKLAICAVMRKLLVIAYGVLKSERPFDPCYNR